MYNGHPAWDPELRRVQQQLDDLKSSPESGHPQNQNSLDSKNKEKEQGKGEKGTQ